MLELVFFALTFSNDLVYVHVEKCVHTAICSRSDSLGTILHLSVPHSRARLSPHFTLNLPAADPLSQTLLSLASLILASLFLTYSLHFTPFLSGTHTHKDLSLLSPRSFTHSDSHFHTYTHSYVLSPE